MEGAGRVLEINRSRPHPDQELEGITDGPWVSGWESSAPETCLWEVMCEGPLALQPGV